MKKKTSLHILIDYPIESCLRTKKKLPKFRYPCRVRNKILRTFLWNQCKDKKNKKQIQKMHFIQDYRVETVIKEKGLEFAWVVGS